MSAESRLGSVEAVLFDFAPVSRQSSIPRLVATPSVGRSAGRIGRDLDSDVHPPRLTRS
jgi:hypothetical protein